MWLTPAKESLREIAIYYKKEYGEKPAKKVVSDITTSGNKLKYFPEMAAIEPLLKNRTKTYRSLVIKKTYKVIYYIDRNIIYIADIWDCRQSPKTNTSKIKG